MGDCACIKGESNFNFKLESLSKEVLLFSDLSEWMDAPQYNKPESYTLNVTIPGGKEAEIEIGVDKYNKITSKELLGREGVSIPDGIYCFVVENCQYKYTRYAAVVRKLECCANTLFIDGGNTTELDRLIKEIKISAEFQDSETANSLYEQATSLTSMKCTC